MRTWKDQICVFYFLGKNLLRAEQPSFQEIFKWKKFPTNRLCFLYEIYRKSFTLFLVLFWWPWYNQRHRDYGAVGRQKYLAAT